MTPHEISWYDKIYLEAALVGKCRYFNSFFLLFLSGEQCERARRLQAKMMTNLVMAKDRLQLLGIN